MSEPQNMRALKLANEVRLTNARRAQRLRALPQAEACEEVASMLVADESPAFEAMWAERLICSIHRYGPGAARSALAAVGVLQIGKRVGELTPRQRCALADLLRDRSPDTLRRQDAA